MARRCACATSASSATRWRNTSCASSWSPILGTSATAMAAIGKTRGTNGGPAFEHPPGEIRVQLQRLSPSPRLRGEGRGEGRSFEFRQERLEHPVQILNDIVVPDADHTI